MRRVFTGYFLWSLLLVIVSSGQLFSETGVSSETDLKKRADHYFTAENYEAALPDYSRLLSLYPREANYNFRFGVCLLLAGKEKANAATYLDIASKDPNIIEDVWYFLGRSYMINNDFSKANDAFEKFKKIANILKQKKYDIEVCIQNCQSGIILSKKRKNVIIVNSTEVARNTFFNSYDFRTASGKIVNAADQFLTEIDHAKQKDPVMYIGNDKQKVFISSYGQKGESGKDIYIIRKTPDNQWSLPENLGTSVNSTADEDYPFLDRDGRTLYFSSKGHNSIGGYDIFKSVFNYNTNQWSEPENLGIPINTTGDDFLFVPDDKGTGVVYATTVESANNSIAIRKIQLPSGINEMLTISGVYIPADQKMRRDARISILTSSGDGIITSVHTDPSTGKYELVLQPGQNYMIVVEGGGYLPHAEIFDLPSGMINPELRQVVKINKDEQKEELTLQNYFSSGAGSTKPSKSITRTYSTKIDSSSMISVKINDQIIYVTPPSASKDESTDTGKGNIDDTGYSADQSVADNFEKTSNDSNALPLVKIKKRDKYDPTLEQGQSTDQIKQEQEETERIKDIQADETNPEKSYDFNVSNEELAKIAYSDAQTIQNEADSVKNEVDELRRKATEKQELSIVQKNDAETTGKSKDSSISLLAKSETNRIEAEELNKQADELVIIASSKQSEAHAAKEEANEIFNNAKTSGSLASNNKKPLKNAPSKNPTNSNSENNGGKSAALIKPDIIKPESLTSNDNKERPVSTSQEINNSQNKSDSGSAVLTDQNLAINKTFTENKNINESSSTTTLDDISLTVETNNGCDDYIPSRRHDENDSIAQNSNVSQNLNSTSSNNPDSSKSSDVISSEKTIDSSGHSDKSDSLNTSDTISTSDNKPKSSGVHHTDSVFALSDAMISKNAPMPVKEEARVAYREYQMKMKHSNELTTQSLSLQEEISRLHSCPERDSLIRESNGMALESINEWREALKKIQEARKIDPGVEYKMNVNDYASNIKKADKNVAKIDKTVLLKSSDSTLQASAVTSKPSSQLPVSENKFNYTSGSNDSSIKYFQDKNDSEANLDTLHPDYPIYVKLKKDILGKQVETIDVFAEAINLNKKSIEEKDNELALMDSAQVETDKDKKSDFIKRSFEQKALSEKHAREAKEKFAMAQQHTQEVKGMKSELASVKERISRKPEQNNLTASTGTNSGNIKLGNTGKQLSPEVSSSVAKQTGKKVSVGKLSPVFAMTTTNTDDLNAGEEEIASVNVTKNELNNFVRNVFGKNQSPAYSEKNPIPMDPVLPEGIVFKVQIGAFHKPLPSDIFKGLQPLSGETTRPGWIRYCSGLFKAFEPANIVKKEIQKIGYKDAFVVAYFNGKRIELNEAYLILKGKENLVAYKSESAKEIAMLRAIDINQATAGSIGDDKDLNEFYGKPALPENAASNVTMEYAVQVGVYRTPKAPSVIASIQPLQTVPAQANLYRFTTGRFPDYISADSAKHLIVLTGIKDAFVVAYKNGVVINSEEFPVTENKIKSGSAENKTAGTVNENASQQASLPGQLIYKIQIGAYKNDVPYNMIESYLNIIDKGITEKTDERGLHIFYVGNCNVFNDASVLQAEIVSKGVKDAFIVALRDGKRIPISDEMKK